jgi:hypothetical protein
MNPSLMKRREALLKRNDAALDRWPGRTGKDFVAEMTAIAKELEALAREVDVGRGDPLERSRNWRYVGNAYFDLANAKDLAHLKLSAGAFQKAEALLAGIDNSIEKMKLDYSYGNTLFHLSDGKDIQMLQEARRRYASAREMAQAHMPAGVESAKSALANAERVIALLTQAEDLSQQASDLRAQIASVDTAPAAAPVSADAALFGQLMDVYRKEVASGKVSETKQRALEPVLGELGNLLENSPTDLDGMTIQRSRLSELMARMSAGLGDTSHGTPPLIEGSRADLVWKHFSELKLYLSSDLMRPHMGSEERFAGMHIYKRCGYADTYLHQSGRDDDAVRKYETDVLRQVAIDARGFSLRHHLTLISPVWASAPLPRNPSGVFFSGAEPLKRVLAKVCAEQKLTLLGDSGRKDFASARWDQLRACHAAVFDFTGYKRPSPDRPVDLAVAGPIAAVSYELGIALTLGRSVIVLADEGQDLPFNVDIEPVGLKNKRQRFATIAEALDHAIYGLQRGGDESSIAATLAYAQDRFSHEQNVVIRESLKLLDREVSGDPVKFRRFLEPVLGSLAADAPQMVFPAWPGSYPDPLSRRCFHVTAFGPAWAHGTMQMLSAACKRAHSVIEYVRGDHVLAPDIIRSIWNNLCQASHVVVDLTGLNANVALELGIAHTLGRKVLLATQDSGAEKHLPSIAKIRMHHYSASGELGMRPFQSALEQFFLPPIVARAT